MKKILLISFAAMLWFSCSKKNGSSPTSAIVGKWYLSADSTAEYSNATLLDHETLTFNHTDYSLFNANGSGSSVSINGNTVTTVNFTYKVSGTALTLNYPQQIIEGDTLYAHTSAATITVLNSSKLETQATVTEVQGGVTYTSFEQDDFGK